MGDEKKSGFTRGRGAVSNPHNRFEKLEYTPEAGDRQECDVPAGVKTVLLREKSRSIINKNDNPDIPFSASVNPYRGCEHGCIYCYARAYHEFLGFSTGLDFETKILVKENAPQLLREALLSPRWKPQGINMCGATDPYQPIERKLKLTRGCLEVLAEFRNPVTIVTKSRLVLRDLDLLGELARFQACCVMVSVTSLDARLARLLEPRATAPSGRLETISKLAQAGVPVGVLVCPVIPGLTDTEIPAIVEAAAKAGALFAGCSPVRLPSGVDQVFEQWLEEHFPERKEKVLGRIRQVRGGTLDERRPGARFTGEGMWAGQIQALFAMACRRAGLCDANPELSCASFRRNPAQADLFDA